MGVTPLMFMHVQHISILSMLAQGLRHMLLGLCMVTSVAMATEPFVIDDIKVQGLQRVEPGTVFATLPFRVGDTFTDDKSTAAISALFATGLFTDVKVSVTERQVVVQVQERPLVAEVSFTGLKEFKDVDILKALRDIGLGEGRPFDQALADRAEQELKRQYLSRSMYAVQVQRTVTPTVGNRVNIRFDVTEGEVATITAIRIVGNQAFETDTLLDEMQLDTGGWLSWYTKSNRYAQTKFAADLEALKNFYLTRGYINFSIESTQVGISPDKQSMTLTVNLQEGRQYRVAEVKLSGDYLGKQDAFAALSVIEVGQPYNAATVEETAQAMRRYFGEFGYAFSQVNVLPQLNDEQGLVALDLVGVPSRRVYVRRIEIEGNERTRDEVIRREFRQSEAAWYDGARIRLSRDRVDRLGYFTNVDVQTRAVTGTPDQVDLVVRVVERPTGNISLGAAYSQEEKISLVLGLQLENVLGSGNYLGLQLNTSKYNRTFSLSHTDPYFTQNGISRTVDVYSRTQRPYDSQLTNANTNYSVVTTGGALRFGLPFSETDTVYVGLGAESIQVKDGASLPDAYREFRNLYGAPAAGYPLTVGWSRDGRDSFLAPTEGRLQRVNFEAGLGKLRYTRLDYQFQQYWPLTKKYTIALNTEFGLGQGSDGRPLPIFKNFYGGGLGSVRGFEQGTFGGKSKVDGSSSNLLNVGGDRKVLANMEFITPFPGAGTDRTLRMFGFVDVGNVYCTAGAGVDCPATANKLRASSGVGISWISPVGPLRLAWAKPLAKQDGDKMQTLQFSIGTSF